MTLVTITHRGETRQVPESEWQATFDDMVARLGPFVPGVSSVTRHDDFKGKDGVDGATGEPMPDAAQPAPPQRERRTSKFGDGQQVHDAQAELRITGLHKALREAGAPVNTTKQLFPTGTRMAESGYRAQAERAAEHEKKEPIREAAARLIAQVHAERRRDVEMTAGDFGAHLTINGALTVDGYKVREQSIRGLLSRMKSPALSYVLGLRDRITGQGIESTNAQKVADKAELLAVLQHECRRFGDVKLKLRTRDGLGDIFAVVSPEYAPADAPEALGDILDALPGNARATYAYDPVSTSWELRASVFTATPTDEQAVGEPFEGFVSFYSRDNGTRRLGGGGGILLVACLNASTYEAASRSVSRRHVGRILVDLYAMSRNATAAIRALCKAWGVARTDIIPAPVVDGKLIPIEEAIPGFYRAMLTARKGELAGILPGRTATNVGHLALAYDEQRRDKVNVTRADLAQGFTRHIQVVPAAVRRDAERAIGQWVVTREPVSYLAE